MSTGHTRHRSLSNGIVVGEKNHYVHMYHKFVTRYINTNFTIPWSQYEAASGEPYFTFLSTFWTKCSIFILVFFISSAYHAANSMNLHEEYI